MNCPHVQPGPQALLWFDLSTFHIRGSKPPCLLLLVVHSPRMVFQRIMRVDGHLAEESTDTFALLPAFLYGRGEFSLVFFHSPISEP